MNLFKEMPVVTLTRFIVRYRKIRVQRLPLLLLYYLRGIAAIPFILCKHLIYSQRIKKTKIVKDPIFILGHYRSGTTLLHKLMAADHRFGYPTNYHVLSPNMSLLFGKPLERLLQSFIYKFRIRNFHFNNLIHELNEPSEEDMCLIHRYSPHAAYWGFIFPRNANEILFMDSSSAAAAASWRNVYQSLLREITYRNNGKQLLLKNPPNTSRINELLEMFPNAKFIYIRRNPVRLYYSMLNLWKKAIVKYYAVQNISDEELSEVLFEHYRTLIRKYLSSRHLIPKENLVEIRYEDLKAHPYGVIQSIYRELKLDDFDEISISLSEAIERQQKYKPFNYADDSVTSQRVRQEWGALMENEIEV